MKTSRTLYVCGVAALSLAVASGGGSVHARRGPSQPLSAAAIGQVACSGTTPPRITRAATFKAEVLLDRLDNAPALIAYTITDDDVRGPFVPEIPRDLEGMARLSELGYRSAAELLAAKFHTRQELIKLLNPGKTIDRAGTVITVPNVADGRPARQVFRIEVDKPANAVRAFGRNDELVAFYPASVGSREKPAPSGTYHVGRVVKDPTYHYDPKFLFKGVKTDRELTIAPGPNNPVGLIWIDLNKPTYGIHGTSHPEEIGKTGSHGCVRLTNWDALDLAKRVRKGTPVAFLDENQAMSHP